MTIEEAQVQLEGTIHSYTNIAIRIERGLAAWDADIGPFEDVRAAARHAYLEVLEEVEAGALRSADIAVNDHFVADTIVPFRARIDALGWPRD